MAKGHAAVSFAPKRHGESVIDAHSPLHAIVGFAAGVAGIDSHLAMAIFISARIVEHSLRSGAQHALFKRETGQSLGNEMGDLLFEIAGLHYGKLLRAKLTAPAAQPAPAAGLGFALHPLLNVSR